MGTRSLRGASRRLAFARVPSPRLETLEAVAEGLDAELILVPKDKLYFILSQLESSGKIQMSDSRIENHPDPWKGLLEE